VGRPMGNQVLRSTVMIVCILALAAPAPIRANGAAGMADGLALEGIRQQQSIPAVPGSASKQCTVSGETVPPVSAPLAAAQKLMQDGKFDEALTAYNAIVPAGGAEAAAAYAGIARVQLEKNDPASAYDAAQKAVALTPDKAPAIVALGEVYFRQGKLPEAQGAFMKPLRACDLDARAFLGLYRVYAMSLNWKHAKTNIDQAFKLDPSDPEIAYYHNQTLTIAEKISALQAQLDDGAAATDESKEAMKKRLESLQARASEPATCRLTTKFTATETALEPLSDLGHVRGYGLTVKINGASARLMMDTGASGISIDQNLADKAGVKKLYETTTSGIGDEHDVASYIGRVAKIQIGNLEFEDCLVDVLKEREIVGEDGLIGADVFRSFLIDISMTKHKMKLTQLPPFPDEPEQEASLSSNSVETKHWHDRYFPPEMKGYTAIFEAGHDLLIPTSVNSSPPRQFLIDTGAFDNQLSLATAKEVTKVRTDYDNSGNIKGLSGKVKTVYRGAEAVIQFANFKQDRSDLFVIDLSKISHGAGTEVSGLLGFRMLYELDMKIDYRDGLIQFSADERYRANNVDVFDSR
jgi:tetratricopeptide (TPR) repeat protein